MGGAVHGRFQGVRLDGHLAKLVANRPVLADGTPKLLPSVGVFHALVDGVLARTNDDPTELDASNVEDVHGNLEAFAAVVEEVFHGHLNVVEEELAGARPFDAHLLFLGIHRDAFEAFFEDEGTQVLVVVNLGKHNHHVGESTVGDPHLLAVEYVVGAGLIQLG